MERKRNSAAKKRIRKKIHLLPWIALLSMVVLVVICARTLLNGYNVQPLFHARSRTISDGWTDEAGEVISLPAKLDLTPNEPYRLQTTLTRQQGEDGPLSLHFTAKYLNVRLFLDEDLLGECLCQLEGQVGTIGKIFAFLPLPDDFEGRVLTLEVTPLLEGNMRREICAPILGAEGYLVQELIRNELLRLAVTAAIFCFSILLLLFALQARKSRNGTFLQTGAFGIVFALYSFSITDSVHLFLSSSRFIYLSEFLLLALLPIPLLALLQKICVKRFQPYLLVAQNALLLNFFLQTLLYGLAHIELRSTVVLTHGVILASAVLLIPVLVLSLNEARDRLWQLAAFSPVIAGALLDLVRFYLPGVYQKALSFQMGVLVFILLQTVYLIRSYLEYYANYLKSKVYHRMAYTDALTGLENRAAFEDMIVEIRKNYQRYSSIWCVCADINNLKQVNDTLGHAMGDELIRGAARVLKAMLSAHSVLYRTGGDEFVLFVFDEPESTLLAGCAKMALETEDYNRAHTAKLSVALGYDSLRIGSSDTITELISRADTAMYQNKRNWKLAHQP